MNHIEYVKQRAGMSNLALAEALGVTPQQVSNWLRGFRKPSEENVKKIAAVLDVDAAWVLGVENRLPVWNPQTGECFIGSIIRSELMPGYGILYHVYLTEADDCIAVIIADSIQYTPCDWSGVQPRTSAEIRNCSWSDGYMIAEIRDGLPYISRGSHVKYQ